MSRLRAAFAVATALLVAYAVLRVVARPVPYRTLATPSRAPVPSPAEVRAVLGSLDALRATAYADPALADPDAWAARSCACRAEDARRLRALARRGLALRGHRTRLVSLTVDRAMPASVVALVTDRTGAYTAVDRHGRIRDRWPASAVRRWRVRLVRVSGRWLLGAVTRGPTGRTS